MEEATDVMAITRMDLTAERIRKQIHSGFYPEEVTLVQFELTREQVLQRVYRVRRAHFGADLHGIVEVSPLSLVSGTTQPFFQFYRSYMNGTALERLVGWGYPDLIKLLKYKQTTLFLNGTFRCVPRPFYQCVVMIVFDNATDLFVPVFYTLCTSKTQVTYWHLMEAVNVAADDKIEPSMVVCDFEVGLQKAAQVQFPDADIVGCYFQFKQACRRKMKALSLPEGEVVIAMSKGYLDMLTVISHEKIKDEDIKFVQGKIRDTCVAKSIRYSDVLWKRFWSYFRTT
ncbi:MULE transposase domain-containing protein [Phytophthora infestans]|uniref:MULE transposase domain-containing protein n=1 Tax=Phytophthora infestans TaxID=4787 RepID=A0A8S9ULW1_PHYIN|nr:MULE transposase domain-containing protein [Phytophthora infestans]